jgi:hypothetical protein
MLIKECWSVSRSGDLLFAGSGSGSGCSASNNISKKSKYFQNKNGLICPSIVVFQVVVDRITNKSRRM